MQLPHDPKRRRAFIGAAVALSAFSLPSRAQKSPESDPAIVPIRALYDALLAAMKQASQLGTRGRYDKLAPVIRATFDLPAMTRIAVGPDWTGIPPDQQRLIFAEWDGEALLRATDDAEEGSCQSGALACEGGGSAHGAKGCRLCNSRGGNGEPPQ